MEDTPDMTVPPPPWSQLLRPMEIPHFAGNKSVQGYSGSASGKAISYVCSSSDQRTGGLKAIAYGNTFCGQLSWLALLTTLYRARMVGTKSSAVYCVSITSSDLKRHRSVQGRSGPVGAGGTL